MGSTIVIVEMSSESSLSSSALCDELESWFSSCSNNKRSKKLPPKANFSVTNYEYFRLKISEKSLTQRSDVAMTYQVTKPKTKS